MLQQDFRSFEPEPLSQVCSLRMALPKCGMAGHPSIKRCSFTRTPVNSLIFSNICIFLSRWWVSTFFLIFRWVETVNWGKCYISETFFGDFYVRPLKSQTHLVTPRIPLLPEGASLEGCSKVKVGDTCSNSWFMMIGKDTMSLNIVSQLCKVDFWIMMDMWFLLQKTSTDCMHETCAYFFRWSHSPQYAMIQPLPRGVGKMLESLRWEPETIQ